MPPDKAPPLTLLRAQLLANARSALLAGWWWWEERPRQRAADEAAFGARSDLLSVCSPSACSMFDF